MQALGSYTADTMSRIETASPVVKPAESIADVAHWRTAAVVTGVLLLAHLPLLVQHATHMWNRPHYQFFPLVPIGAVVLDRKSVVRERG